MTIQDYIVAASARLSEKGHLLNFTYENEVSGRKLEFTRDDNGDYLFTESINHSSVNPVENTLLKKDKAHEKILELFCYKNNGINLTNFTLYKEGDLGPPMEFKADKIVTGMLKLKDFIDFIKTAELRDDGEKILKTAFEDENGRPKGNYTQLSISFNTDGTLAGFIKNDFDYEDNQIGYQKAISNDNGNFDCEIKFESGKKNSVEMSRNNIIGMIKNYAAQEDVSSLILIDRKDKRPKVYSYKNNNLLEGVENALKLIAADPEDRRKFFLAVKWSQSLAGGSKQDPVTEIEHIKFGDILNHLTEKGFGHNPN